MSINSKQELNEAASHCKNAADDEQLSQLDYASAPGDIQQHLATQTFIDGIWGQVVKKALLIEDYRTIRPALVQALKLETAKKAADIVVPVQGSVADQK